MIKIATWNVNSLRVRLEHVAEWLRRHEPHILALQETKVQDCDFPLQPLREAGYHAVFAGEKSFNGVAILGKTPPQDIVSALPDSNDPQRRLLAATVDGIRIINLYVPNGQSLSSDKFRYKLQWLEKACAFIEEQMKRYDMLAVMGDFNIAPADIDVHDPALWQNKVLVSDPERTALTRIIRLGLCDLFRHINGQEQVFSWWDYRGGLFWKNAGLRIDLILATQALTKRCTQCQIDIRPRKLKRPSDHAPVWAQLRPP